MCLSSSMEVLSATDVGMGDRRLVRGAGSRLAIQTIPENGMQRWAGTGVDLDCPCTSGLQAIPAKGLGQPQNTHAGPVARFRMTALAHDNLDKGFGVRADPGGLSAYSFGRPICPEPMVRWHVITLGGVLAIAGCALVSSHALALKIGAVLHQSPDKRGVPLPVKMVSQLTQTWHSQVRSFC